MEARFSPPVQTGPGVHSASCTMGTGSFPGGKERPGRDADPSPPSSAVSHERVELCLSSPCGPYGMYRASVELYLYSPYGPYGLYRASVELCLYSLYGPYSLYRASVELCLYSPCGPYGLYRASVPVQGVYFTLGAVLLQADGRTDMKP